MEKVADLEGFSITAFDSFNCIMVPIHDITSPTNEQEGAHEKPLDKEDDRNVLKKCLFVSNLPLFIEIEDIKNYLKNIPLNDVKRDRVEDVCLVSREDLTYTKTAIVKLYLEEDVTNILVYDVDVPHKIGLNVKLSRLEGMKSQYHAYVYTNGKYRMVISLKHRESMRAWILNVIHVVASSC